MMTKSFLCIGHPRCGTGYISHLLTAFGWQVGHEDMKVDGISSWMLAVYSHTYPWGTIGKRFNTSIDMFIFSNIIHVIRNPFDAIPSIILEHKYSPTSYNFMREHIHKILEVDLPEYSNSRTLQEDITIAIQTYLYWNEICSIKSSIVVRVEDSFEHLQEYNKSQVSFDTTATLFRNSTETKLFGDKKRYVKPTISLEEYNNINISLLLELQKFCHKYGYQWSKAIKH